MDPARRLVASVLVALALLVGLDAVIANVDVFTPLVPDWRPTTLFAQMNRQVVDVVRTLYRPPPGPPPVVFLGNSLLENGIRPLGVLERTLVAAGAPPGTQALSFCVFGTAPTDAEVIARSLGRVRPGVVIIGLGATDVGTPLEHARRMPVTHVLDTGFRDGLVPPADWEGRFDRWVRTSWRLYRYRALFHDLVRPPDEQRTPTSPRAREQVQTPAELLETAFGPERAHEILALRATFDRTGAVDDFVHYVDLFRGQDYVTGLRERWQALEIEPLQLEALRRFVAHVRDAGGRPVWLLMPENPVFARDPVVGPLVARGSDAVAARLASEAAVLDVPLLDLRRAMPVSAFADYNHLFRTGVFFPVLTKALADRGLLAAPARAG